MARLGVVHDPLPGISCPYLPEKSDVAPGDITDIGSIAILALHDPDGNPLVLRPRKPTV